MSVELITVIKLFVRCSVFRTVFHTVFELELELIQAHMTQKPKLRVEVGAVSCSRCACAAHKGHFLTVFHGAIRCFAVFTVLYGVVRCRAVP